MRGIGKFAALLAAACLAAVANAGDEEGRPASRVVVTGADGKPAAGATVMALSMGGYGSRGAWLPAGGIDVGLRGVKAPVHSRDATADANGVATLSFGTNHLCLIAFLGDQSVLQCAVAQSALEGRTATYEVRLEPAKTISGRLLDADGKPVAGARLRLAVAGSEEWHFLEAEIGADGAFRLPPVPGRLLRDPDTHVEARAPGCVEARVDIDEKAAGRPVDVRFARARVLRGKLHAADAIRDANLRTSDRYHGPQAQPDADGSFTLDGISAATRRVYVESRSHATRIVELPAGAGDADLGVIELEPGHGVNGKILGPDGGKGGTLTVGLVDDQGFELATMDTDVRAVFDFAHAGSGADHLVARTGAGGELWIFERGKFAGEMGAPPFVVRFRDTSGAPTLVDVARLVWTGSGQTETSIVRMVSYLMGVHAIRLRLPGPGALRVEIDGREPIVLDKVDVAADGTGEAVVTVPR